MKHVTASQLRLETVSPPIDEWERLPWLMDEPRRARTRPRARLLVATVLLVTADAVGAYETGRLSVREGWGLESAATEGSWPALPPGLSPEQTRVLGKDISAAERVGWSRRRANAAY